MACTPHESENVMPGFICCACKAYNGAWRDRCKFCRHEVCGIEPPEWKRLRDGAWEWINYAKDTGQLPFNWCPANADGRDD